MENTGKNKWEYFPEDVKEEPGKAGKPPYTRGIYSTMYKGKKFTMRQLAGLGTAEDCNQRVRYLLDHGATGISILFDLPTIRGYDSDDPEAEGNVGQCGTAINSLWDMDAFFKGIPLDSFSTSIVTHLPSTSLVIPGMYFSVAERRGILLNKLEGTCQNDFLMETIVGSAPEILPPKVSFRMQCDVVEWVVKNVPRWNPISFNGYNLREAGTDAVTEVAVAIANAIETANELLRRGLKIDDFAPRFSFFWAAGNDFFEEIAKCRASRKVWYEVMTKYAPKNKKSSLMRFHVQTSGISLSGIEPLNNIARSTIQGVAAVLGGAQSLHIDSFDEAYSAPTEKAALVSLRTQQIIQNETGITNIIDPLGGSYFIEYLTSELGKQIMNLVEEIEGMGGIVKVVENGWLHNKISQYQYEQQQKIESGEIKVIGEGDTPIEVFKYPETFMRQKTKLEKLRKERDSFVVCKNLKLLRDECHTSKNLFPSVWRAVKSLATLGEIEEVFREEFGLWQSEW